MQDKAKSILNTDLNPTDNYVIRIRYGHIDQLVNLANGPIYDGNLIGKYERNDLVELGFVDRVNGWNFLTRDGVELLIDMRILKP